MMRPAPNARGFTLAEALVTVVILGLIGTLTFGSFANFVRGREQAETMSTHYHQVRLAMLRMSREIQMAYITNHRDCDDPKNDSMFRGKRDSNGMRLDFTAFSHFKTRADANESDQEELSYYVDTHPDDSDLGLALIRRSQPRVDDEPEEGGIDQVLCENVTNLEFEFYDAKEDTWEDEWDTKGTDYKDRMPMFVKIAMKVKNPHGEEEEFITKTRVHLQRSIEVFGTNFVKCVD